MPFSVRPARSELQRTNKSEPSRRLRKWWSIYQVGFNTTHLIFPQPGPVYAVPVLLCTLFSPLWKIEQQILSELSLTNNHLSVRWAHWLLTVNFLQTQNMGCHSFPSFAMADFFFYQIFANVFYCSVHNSKLAKKKHLFKLASWLRALSHLLYSLVGVYFECEAVALLHFSSGVKQTQTVNKLHECSWMGQSFIGQKLSAAHCNNTATPEQWSSNNITA